MNHGPLPFWDDRFGDPIHVEGEVVDPPQKHVGGDRALVQSLQKMFGLGFDQGQVPERFKGWILDGDIPAFLGVARFQLAQLCSTNIIGCPEPHEVQSDSCAHAKLLFLPVTVGHAKCHCGEASKQRAHC